APGHVCRLFFFSSRRRHTRSKRDWSSDVCSSDLPGDAGVELGERQTERAIFCAREEAVRDVLPPGHPLGQRRAALQPRAEHYVRSEERRVGKECRSRWAREREKTTDERPRLRSPA